MCLRPEHERESPTYRVEIINSGSPPTKPMGRNLHEPECAYLSCDQSNCLSPAWRDYPTLIESRSAASEVRQLEDGAHNQTEGAGRPPAKSHDELWEKVTTVALEIILSAGVAIGVVFFWCDFTNSWKDIRALLAHYSK